MARLVCPIKGCGKEYVKGTMDEALRSLQAHLTGKHCLKGDAYDKAIGESVQRACEEKEKLGWT